MTRSCATPRLGTAVASFSLAVDRDFKDKSTGERSTDFIDVVAWRQTGEFVSRYFTKGRMAVVEGRLQIRTGRIKTAASAAAPRSWRITSTSATPSGTATGRLSDAPAMPPAAVTPAAMPRRLRPPLLPAPAAPSGYGAPSMGGDQFAELSDDDGELPF